MPIASHSVMPPSPLRRPPVCAADLVVSTTAEPEQNVDAVDRSFQRQHKRYRAQPSAPRVIPRPRKLDTEPPLRLLLGCVRMTEKWTAALQCDAIESQNPALWRTLAAEHERLASRLLWPQGVTDNVMVLKLSHVRLILAQRMIDVHVVHLIYWLLVSPSGPQHVVAYTPRAETRLRTFFNASGMKFAHRYLDQSRYRLHHHPCSANLRMTDETQAVTIALLEALNAETVELPL